MEEFKYENTDPTEHLERDEPFFFIRARDNLSVEIVRAYQKRCNDLGMDQNAKEVGAIAAAMEVWRSENSGSCKYATPMINPEQKKLDL